MRRHGGEAPVTRPLGRAIAPATPAVPSCRS